MSVIKFRSEQQELRTEDLKECCKKFGFSDRFEEYKDLLSRFGIALEIAKDRYTLYFVYIYRNII